MLCAAFRYGNTGSSPSGVLAAGLTGLFRQTL